MAKLNNGKSIVIKINGKNRSYQEEPVLKEAENIHKNQSKASVSVSSSPTNDAVAEAAASHEIQHESFDWVLPEQDEIESDGNEWDQRPADNPVADNETRQKGTFKPILLSVIFAVLLGTSFGIVMLKLVSTGQMKQSAQTMPLAPVSDKKASPAASSAPDFTLKAWTAYVVQGGVFSTKEAAKSVLSQDGNSGVPAEIIGMNGKQYVLIGVANTMEEAKSLGDYLQGKGIGAPYSKSLSIPEKNLSNVTADEKAFIKAAASLFPILTDITSNPLDSGAIPKETFNTITALGKNISKINSGKLHQSKLRDLKTEITAAAEQIKSYQKSHDPTKFANAQQHLLTFLSVYYSL